MKQVNMHEAKTHLSRLVEEVARGEPFIIAKAGKPVAKVTAIDSPADHKRQRLGFMAKQFRVPHNFDRLKQREIEQLFTVEQ